MYHIGQWFFKVDGIARTKSSLEDTQYEGRLPGDAVFLCHPL